MRILVDETAMLVRMAVRFAVRIGRRMRMPMMRLPVAWERINEIWYDYVKGLNPAAYFGIFDVVRLDTSSRRCDERARDSATRER